MQVYDVILRVAIAFKSMRIYWKSKAVNKIQDTRKPMSSVRVEPHLRGHIASCNGKLELVQARVEASREPGGWAREVALKEEVTRQEEQDRKAKRLLTFQHQVKQRVLQRERSKQQQLAAQSSQAVQCEQRVAEQAVALDTTSAKAKFQRPAGAPDVEDIRVTASYVRPIAQSDGRQSAIQLARRKLLLQKASPSSLPPEVHHLSDRPQYSDVQPYKELTTEVECTEPEKADKPEPKSAVLRRFASQGQLEHARKRQASTQYLLFRRLYSDLEREQTRQRQQQLAHRQRVQQLKKTKEMERRLAEDQVNVMDSYSVSTEAVEDQQRATEWAELLALEQRKQRLQKARETDRYIAALREKLRQRIAHRQATVPPLCSCGTSVWDTNPDTCANNCIFYRNSRAYAQALSTLLLSLET